MADDKTAISELATALGMLEVPDAAWGIHQRPEVLAVSPETWEQLDRSMHRPELVSLAGAAFANGRAFAASPEGLDRRAPRRIEWTGGRRPPGDQVIPADLRVDRVWLVSCKYSSRVLHNAAPARVFDHLLLATDGYDRGDWYAAVAPEEHRSLADAACRAVGLTAIGDPAAATRADRRRLRDALREVGRRWPDGTEDRYTALCRTVSEESAARWRSAASTAKQQEQLLWRLLRLASAPYFVLGTSGDDHMRLRIETPWDWRQRFRLRTLRIEAAAAGQPQVRWSAVIEDAAAGTERTIDGHVEIRWSHGRFGGPPEAKVYLDTPHADVPGYTPLPPAPSG